MPDVPDAFDELIAQARQLRQEGNIDEAISSFVEADKVDGSRPELCELAELYVQIGRPIWAISHLVDLSLYVLTKHGEFPNISEEVEVYDHILDTTSKLFDDQIVDSPGPVYAFLNLCALGLGENDLHNLRGTTKEKLEACGWTDSHTGCFMKYYAVLGNKDGYDQALETLYEMAEKTSAAWYYVGALEGLKGNWIEEVPDAFNMVPKNDPNYVRAMLWAGEYSELSTDLSISQQGEYSYFLL